MPYTAKAPLGLIRHHLDTVPEAPHVRNPDVPEDLSRIVMRLLEKDPADRFENAAALRAALAACDDAGSWSAEDAAAWWERFGAVSRVPGSDREGSRTGS